MKPPPRTIGFTGQATAGKTSAAVILAAQYDLARMSFADPIRDMLKALGLDDAEMSEHKNVPNALLCNRTPRYAMQKLGTEFGRQMIGENIWVNAAMQKADLQSLVFGNGVVFDDVRFDNEAAAIREAGGIVIEVSKPDLPPRMDHASERGVSPALIDHYVHAVDLIELKAKLLALFNEKFTA